MLAGKDSLAGTAQRRAVGVGRAQARDEPGKDMSLGFGWGATCTVVSMCVHEQGAEPCIYDLWPPGTKDVWGISTTTGRNMPATCIWARGSGAGCDRLAVAHAHLTM